MRRRVCVCNVYTMRLDRSGGTRVEKKVRVLHNGESIIIIYYSYSYYYFMCTVLRTSFTFVSIIARERSSTKVKTG